MNYERLIACPNFGRKGYEELLDIVAEFEYYYRNGKQCFAIANYIKEARERLEEALQYMEK